MIKTIILFLIRLVLATFILVGIYHETGKYTTIFAIGLLIFCEWMGLVVKMMYSNQISLQKQNSTNDKNIRGIYGGLTAKDNVTDTLHATWFPKTENRA